MQHFLLFFLFYLGTRLHKYFVDGEKEGMKMKKSEDFLSAIAYLPHRLKDLMQNLNDDFKSSIWEVRLRRDMPLILINKNGSNFLYPNARVSLIYNRNAVTVTEQEITECFNKMCGYSVHTNSQNIVQGFLSLEGGHRAGICGTAVYDSELNFTTLRDISSINLRIASEHIGTANEIYELLFKNSLSSVIIGGVPSSGKTTILRDLSRQLSDYSRGDFYKVAIADERGEICAVSRGKAQKNAGFCDILNGYPKADAINIAIRTLSPQVIICDEIGTSQEVDAVCEGLNAGVNFAISAHMQKKEDLFLRPPLKKLVNSGAFAHLVMLKGSYEPSCIDGIYNIKELQDENCGCNFSDPDICTFRQLYVANTDTAS